MALTRPVVERQTFRSLARRHRPLCYHATLRHPLTCISITYAVHVDSVRERPRVLIWLDEPVCQRLWNVMELDELFDTRQLLVVLLRAAVQSQHDRRDITKYGGTHQRCNIKSLHVTRTSTRVEVQKHVRLICWKQASVVSCRRSLNYNPRWVSKVVEYCIFARSGIKSYKDGIGLNMSIQVFYIFCQKSLRIYLG